MSGRWAVAALGFGLGLAGLSGGAFAQTFHNEVRVGKNSCFDGHFHFGSSKGLASKKAAEASAVASWQDFVDFEYGSAYSSWKIATSKSVECAKENVGWGCAVSAIPCRRLRK